MQISRLMKLRRTVALMATAVMTMSMPVTSLAAPATYTSVHDISQDQIQALTNIDLHPIFDADYYAKNNTDAVAQVGNDPEALYQHFITQGLKANRKFNPNFTINDIKKLFNAYKDKFGNDARLYLSLLVQRMAESAKEDVPGSVSSNNKISVTQINYQTEVVKQLLSSMSDESDSTVAAPDNQVTNILSDDDSPARYSIDRDVLAKLPMNNRISFAPVSNVIPDKTNKPVVPDNPKDEGDIDVPGGNTVVPDNPEDGKVEPVLPGGNNGNTDTPDKNKGGVDVPGGNAGNIDKPGDGQTEEDKPATANEHINALKAALDNFWDADDVYRAKKNELAALNQDMADTVQKLEDAGYEDKTTAELKSMLTSVSQEQVAAVRNVEAARTALLSAEAKVEEYGNAIEEYGQLTQTLETLNSSLTTASGIQEEKQTALDGLTQDLSDLVQEKNNAVATFQETYPKSLDELTQEIADIEAKYTAIKNFIAGTDFSLGQDTEDESVQEQMLIDQQMFDNYKIMKTYLSAYQVLNAQEKLAEALEDDDALTDSQKALVTNALAQNDGLAGFIASSTEETANWYGRVKEILIDAGIFDRTTATKFGESQEALATKASAFNTETENNLTIFDRAQATIDTLNAYTDDNTADGKAYFETGRQTLNDLVAAVEATSVYQSQGSKLASHYNNLRIQQQNLTDAQAEYNAATTDEERTAAQQKIDNAQRRITTYQNAAAAIEASLSEASLGDNYDNKSITEVSGHTYRENKNIQESLTNVEDVETFVATESNKMETASQQGYTGTFNVLKEDADATTVSLPYPDTESDTVSWDNARFYPTNNDEHPENNVFEESEATSDTARSEVNSAMADMDNYIDNIVSQSEQNAPAELEAQITALQNALPDYEASITQYETDIAELETQISDAETDIAPINAEVTSLQEQVQETQNSIDTWEGTYTSVEDTEDAKSGFEADAETCSTNLDQAIEDQNAIDQEVQDLEEAVEMSEHVDDLIEQIDTAQQDVDEAYENADEAAEMVGEAYDNCTEEDLASAPEVVEEVHSLNEYWTH